MIPPALPFEYHRISDIIMGRMAGRPFCHLGRGPEQGFDCLGLMIYYFTSMGLPLVVLRSAETYSREYWMQGADVTYLNEILCQFAVVKEGAVSKGDLVMFKPPSLESTVGHTGIVMDPEKKTFIQAFSGRGITVSRWTDRFWQRLLFGFARHRKMDLLVERRSKIPASLKV